MVNQCSMHILSPVTDNCPSGEEEMKVCGRTGNHTCQVLGKSKSEIARTSLIFAYNLVIERAEKSGAQVLRVRFFLSLKRHKLQTQREISNTVLPYPYHLLSTTLNLLSL